MDEKKILNSFLQLITKVKQKIIFGRVKASKIIFGTDGWRALLDKEITDESIVRVAQAFAQYINLKGTTRKVAIGFDGRKKSDHFAQIFSRVLVANHIEVLLSDRVTPTPVVSWITRNRQCDAGVMVTASHNPPQYNGIKFKSKKGSPFASEETALVESFIDKRFPLKSAQPIPGINFIGPWLSHIDYLIDFEKIKEANISVLIDSMSGAGGTILEDILNRHGIEATTIFGIPTPDFSGRLAEPVAKNLTPLSEALKKGKYSLGVATDGDADRLGVMDEKGNWMNIQETILYLAEYYTKIRRINGPLVKTASVTDKLLNTAKKLKTQTLDVQVGFKYVAEAMLEHDASFGAEESGGFGFRENIPERDGIFSALIFLEMLARSKHTKLSTFIEEQRKRIGKIYYDRIDMENKDEKRFTILPKIDESPPEKVAGYTVHSIQTYKSSHGIVNGLKIRMEGNPRWLLLRISETEPLVRIYAEAENDQEVQKLLGFGKKLFFQ